MVPTFNVVEYNAAATIVAIFAIGRVVVGGGGTRCSRLAHDLLSLRFSRCAERKGWRGSEYAGIGTRGSSKDLGHLGVQSSRRTGHLSYAYYIITIFI